MYYFASDQHLGLEGCGDPRERERLVVRWLEEVSGDAKAIFLLGDLFDFWWEYKRVIPKGFSRLLGKLSELNDRGVEVHLFLGNHDLWAFDYLNSECGVILHHREEVVELEGKRVFMGHGDNLRTGSWVVSLMNWLFRNRFVQRATMFFLRPNVLMRFGVWWSSGSRKSKTLTHTFRGEEEYLVQFARDYCKQDRVDYFLFGHVHVAKKYDLGEGVSAIFLGEWIENPTFAVMKEGVIELKKYR